MNNMLILPLIHRVLDNDGRRGISAIFTPKGLVSWPLLSNAPRAYKTSIADNIILAGGGDGNVNLKIDRVLIKKFDHH